MRPENDLLLRVAEHKTVDRPPIWLMRQAGRFLSEYRAVRAQAGSFQAMIENPAYAAEVTLQPVDLVGVDAAIIFSDILVIPEAMGLLYHMVEKKGPVFPQTISTQSDIDRLKEIEGRTNLNDTTEAIEMVIEQLENRVPLIGFCGAPWTIFCYMVEGSGSKTFSKAKSMLYQSPEMSHSLLQKITTASIKYLKMQIAAGVHLVQIFDSWAGILDRKMYNEFALPYIKQICDAIQETPKTVFAKGAYFSMDEIFKLDCNIVGLDWNMQVADMESIRNQKALQGNLDPCQLYATKAEVKAATEAMLQRFPAQRHVANLGHGIYPDLPRENVIEMIETVKGFRY